MIFKNFPLSDPKFFLNKHNSLQGQIIVKTYCSSFARKNKLKLSLDLIKKVKPKLNEISAKFCFDTWSHTVEKPIKPP